MKFLKISILTCSVFACLLILGPSSAFGINSNFSQGADSPDVTKAKVDSLEIVVDDLVRSNNLAEAYKLSHKGLKMAREIGYTEGLFNLSLQLSGQFLNRNNPDSTIFYSELALDLAETDIQQKKALNSLGNGHAKAGRSIIAIDLYEQVLELADSLSNDHYSVGVLINLATAYSNQGEDNKGLQYYFRALERSEELGNKEFIAIITNNLGDKYNDVGNYEQAEYYLLRSMEISEREGIRSNLVRVLLNIGNTYKHTGQYDKAEESYTRVLEMHRESGNTTGEIQVNYNLGMMYLAKKEYRTAREYLQLSLNDSRALNLLPGIFYSVNGLGQLELELGNISESIDFYSEGVSIVDTIDNKQMRKVAYNNMYNAYKRIGNSTQALNWLERVNELDEELRSFERDRLMAEYETKFNLRRSEQEKRLIQLQQEQQQAQLDLQRTVILLSFAGITFLLIAGFVLIRTNQKRKNVNEELLQSNMKLKKLNDKVQEQKEELERLNNIKTKLFAIIAHDLRGPLSSLQSLLYLLREHNLSEEETRKLTSNLEKNMLENSSMMDNLLGWAQSQMNGITLNMRIFDLKFCVESVLDQFILQLENKQIKLDVEVADGTMIYADYDLMKLVIRNLLANAIKFSNPDSTITIRSEKADDHFFQVAVIDSGVGIPKQNQSKIFSSENFTSQGTENEKGNGLGLNLCKEYVEKHGGSIWFTSVEGEGTSFYFTIASEKKKEELVNA